MINKIFTEIENNLLYSDKPSNQFNKMIKEGKFNNSPFNILLQLQNIMQNEKYHPEGNVWNHTMLVVDEAAKIKEKSTNEKAFMWAALLHDIGKIKTTKIRNGKWTSYDHDIVGSDMARRFLENFDLEDDFINEVVYLVRWHMQILYVNMNLPYENVKQMVKQVNIQDISMLCFCDRKGRGNISETDVEEIKRQVNEFIKKARKEEKKLTFQM